MDKETLTQKSDNVVIEKKEKKQCGIVMPIAQMTYIHQEYTEDHWAEVYRIICEACEDYTPRLVSESKTSGMILTDIVQNLYKDDVVICDISGRNPNVFFELGMRLTFDKPTVILKDDETKIPFDIQGVRMIIYPIGLNYHKINKLKNEIKDAILETFENQKKGKTNTFLKHFKDFNIQPSKLESENVTQDEVRMLKIENQLDIIMNYVSNNKGFSNRNKSDDIPDIIDLDLLDDLDIDLFINSLSEEDERLILKDNSVIPDRLMSWLFSENPKYNSFTHSKKIISRVEKMIKNK